MKIISTSPREPKGRNVELDGTVYEFRPDADGQNACEVKDPDHIERLLSITEGYTSPDAPKKKEKPAPVERPKDEVLGGTEKIDGGEDNDGDGEDEPMTRAEMEEAYRAKFGQSPHPAMKDATLAARLAEG